MKEIKRIQIESMSGYTTASAAYEDKLVLEKNTISYEFNPVYDTNPNHRQKWKYKATSPAFEEFFGQVSTVIQDIMRIDPGEEVYDIGGTDFTVTFIDKTKWKQSFYFLSEEILTLFSIIKKMIPSCETIPVVLGIEEEMDLNPVQIE